MPGAADEIAAYKLRSMGLANAGQQDATGGRVSPSTFLTNSAPQKLAPEAADALFGSNPAVAQRLQDLSTAAGAMKSTERFLNTSNTGTHGATGHMMASMMAMGPAALEGYHLAGVPGAVASGVGALAVPYLPGAIASRLTTSPMLTGLLAAPPAAALPSAGLLSAAGKYPSVYRPGLLGGPQSGQ